MISASRFIFRASLLFVVIFAAGHLYAAQDVSSQWWGNVILSYPKSEKLYFELDFEPKLTLSGDVTWRNLDTTPLVEYYLNKWIDLTGEVVIGFTKQSNDTRSFELSPRIGIRIHFLENITDQLRPERLPRRRVTLASLLRIEYRNLAYSGDMESEHEWRLRNRFEFKLPINNINLAIDRTLYIMADYEAYIPLGNEVAESFATKGRLRAGLGYRKNYKWRIELLYIRDWAKDTIEEKGQVSIHAIDLRLKIFF